MQRLKRSSRLPALLALALAACIGDPAGPEYSSELAGDSTASCEDVPLTACPGDEIRRCESSCSCAEEGPNGEPSNGDCACLIQCICAAE